MTENIFIIVLPWHTDSNNSSFNEDEEESWHTESNVEDEGGEESWHTESNVKDKDGEESCHHSEGSHEDEVGEESCHTGSNVKDESGEELCHPTKNPTGPCAACQKEGALLRCVPCRDVGIDIFFCNRDCQGKLWKTHKAVCGKVSTSDDSVPKDASSKGNEDGKVTIESKGSCDKKDEEESKKKPLNVSFKTPITVDLTQFQEGIDANYEQNIETNIMRMYMNLGYHLHCEDEEESNFAKYMKQFIQKRENAIVDTDSK